MNINDSFNQFIETLDGQSKANLKNYRQRLKLFIGTHGDSAPTAITPADINIWYATIDNGKRKPTTLNGYKQAIKAFFNWLHSNEHISTNPTRHLTNTQSISQEVRVPAEADVRLVTTTAYKWMQSKRPKERRAACLWFWSLESGGRLGGFLYLKLREFERGAKRPDTNGVYQFNTVSKGRENLLEVTVKTVRATWAWFNVRPISETAELITSLTKPYNPIVTETACDDYEMLSAAAGLDYTIASHMMRHRMGTLITEKYDAKIAAMKLNHADWQKATTAITYYYRPSRSAVSSVTAELSNPIRK